MTYIIVVASVCVVGLVIAFVAFPQTRPWIIGAGTAIATGLAMFWEGVAKWLGSLPA